MAASVSSAHCSSTRRTMMNSPLRTVVIASQYSLAKRLLIESAAACAKSFSTNFRWREAENDIEWHISGSNFVLAWQRRTYNSQESENSITVELSEHKNDVRPTHWDAVGGKKSRSVDLNCQLAPSFGYQTNRMIYICVAPRLIRFSATQMCVCVKCGLIFIYLFFNPLICSKPH